MKLSANQVVRRSFVLLAWSAIILVTQMAAGPVAGAHVDDAQNAVIFGRAKPGAKKFINFNHRDHNQANEKYQLNWAYSQRNPPSASEIKTLGRQTLGHAAPKSEVSPKLANRLVAQGGAGESLKSDQAVAGVAASISAVQDKLLDGQSKLADNGTNTRKLAALGGAEKLDFLAAANASNNSGQKNTARAERVFEAAAGEPASGQGTPLAQAPGYKPTAAALTLQDHKHPPPSLISSVLTSRPTTTHGPGDATWAALIETSSDQSGERLVEEGGKSLSRLLNGAAGERAQLIGPMEHERRGTRAIGQPASSNEVEAKEEEITSVIPPQVAAGQEKRNIIPVQFSHILLGLNMTSSATDRDCSIDNWLKSSFAKRAMRFMHFG